MGQDLIDTDDIRHGAELITDAAAGVFGLQALGFEPLKGLPMINPGDVILGIVFLFAIVSFIGTFTMIQQERL